MQFRRSLLMLMVVVLAVALIFVGPANVAKAAPPSSPDIVVSPTCGVSLTFTSVSGATYVFRIWDDGFVVASSSGIGSGGDISLSNPLEPYKSGAPGVGLELLENGASVFYNGSFIATQCETRGARTFYYAGDGRVDPRPGDRVAVYCSADKLTVYGVLNDSRGVFLATFSYADLVSAGAAGISKRVEPLGTVFASLSGTSSFNVRWTGGPAAATGVRDFAKAFTCALS